MVVVSLFDGMSCGQIALTELGVDIEKYYASEVDIHAIKQTQLNFPKTIQLGDITKWREWDIDWSKVDLIGAGSPCQGFSFAGKQLAFDDPRSKLFFEFALILKHAQLHNPNVKFLLENVDMKREYMRIISEYVGIFPVNINSNLVSAQNRSRWYWSNIRTNVRGLFDELYTDIPQPKDRGILLKDILEKEVPEKYYLSDKGMLGMIKHKQNNINNGNGFGVQYIDEDTNKSNTLLQRYYKVCKDNAVCVASRGRNPDNPSDRRTGTPTEQRLEPNLNGKTNCLTSVAKDNLIMQINPSTESGGKQPYQQNRIYDADGIAPALCENKADLLVMTNPFLSEPIHKHGENRYYEGKAPTIQARYGTGGDNIPYVNNIRRLTPTECARLQTIPDWYIWNCSDTQIYRMCGNGWTIEVIKHILSFCA